jgi:hypothetical protein
MIRGYEGIVTAFKGEPVVYVFDGVHAHNTPLGSVPYQRQLAKAFKRGIGPTSELSAYSVLRRYARRVQ